MPAASVPSKRQIASSLATSLPGRRGTDGDGQPRLKWQERAASLDGEARRAAESGDVAASARLILESLDCERRAGGIGPQVLQLIKPRG
jgi:hypothetical protein